MRKRSIIQMTLVGVAVGIALALVAVLIPWLPEPAAEESGQIDNAYWLVTGICVFIFAIVAGISVYAVWKFRAAPDDMDDGSPIHGHTGLEIAWTIIPTILVTAIAVYSSVVLVKVENIPADHRVVRVLGQQFAWSFTYRERDGEELTTTTLALPVGEPVELLIEARDVIHSFWVPEWRMKQDAVPGITTRLVITPSKTGTFTVVCTELCGLGHATMRARAEVKTAAEFERWLEDQRRARERAGAVQGEQLFAQQCGSCHALAAAGTEGQVGPDLDNVLPGQSAEEIRESIVNPNAEVTQGFQPGVMPDNFEDILSEQQLDGLVEYLVQSAGAR